MIYKSTPSDEKLLCIVSSRQGYWITVEEIVRRRLGSWNEFIAKTHKTSEN